MRKAIVFIISMAMLVGGLYLLTAHYFWATEHVPKMGLAAVTLVAVGAALLWIDFLAPMFGIKAD
jgi:hypothetical protein